MSPLRHSVPIYFALVFLISWGGILLVLSPQAVPLRAEEFESLGALAYAAILAGPCVAGILMTRIVSGRLGLRQLLGRLRRWRVGWGWYGLALLPALGVSAAALLLSYASADFRLALLDSDDKAGVLLRALGPALLVGSLEEIGWTGFAVPRLRAHHSILVTGLVVGMVWGAWHFPLFWEAGTFSAALPLAILVTRLFSWLPPFRVLLVWIHDRTESLPVVMFMHAMVSFTAIALAPGTQTGARLLISVLASAVTMWVLLAVFLLTPLGSRRATAAASVVAGSAAARR